VWTTAIDAEYRTSDDRYTLYRCLSCGVLFIDPVPRERLSEIYPPNYYSFADQKNSLMNTVKSFLDRRLFRKILREVPGDVLNALDIGGGSGWEMNVVRTADPRVKFTQVVDFDPCAEVRARQNGHEYFSGRIEEFSTDHLFDFVLMLNILEHVENPLGLLKQVQSLLSPHGRVLIKTPNYDSLDARIFRDMNWAGFHCPRHWVIFTKESLYALIERADLRVVDFAYTQGAPFWAMSMLCWMERRGWTSITNTRPVIYHALFPLFCAFFAAFDYIRKPIAKTSQMFVVLGRK
jgi:SAM-dependent methyltransferase